MSILKRLVEWHQGPLAVHVYPHRWWRLSDWRTAKQLARFHDWLWEHGGMKEAATAAVRDVFLTGQGIPSGPWVRKEKIH